VQDPQDGQARVQACHHQRPQLSCHRDGSRVCFAPKAKHLHQGVVSTRMQFHTIWNDG
jgi:hypothetical protein